jgi:hypothetical protein
VRACVGERVTANVAKGCVRWAEGREGECERRAIAEKRVVDWLMYAQVRKDVGQVRKNGRN